MHEHVGIRCLHRGSNTQASNTQFTNKNTKTIHVTFVRDCGSQISIARFDHRLDPNSEQRPRTLARARPKQNPPKRTLTLAAESD